LDVAGVVSPRDLKPWLSSRLHPAFDAAMLEGRKTFAGANRYWADLVHAGADFAFQPLALSERTSVLRSSSVAGRLTCSVTPSRC
jgi:hypothetical protein